MSLQFVRFVELSLIASWMGHVGQAMWRCRHSRRRSRRTSGGSRRRSWTTRSRFAPRRMQGQDEQICVGNCSHIFGCSCFVIRLGPWFLEGGGGDGGGGGGSQGEDLQGVRRRTLWNGAAAAAIGDVRGERRRSGWRARVTWEEDGGNNVQYLLNM